MTRFVVGEDRSTLFPERLDVYLAEDNPVGAIDVFDDELDLGGLGFGGIEPEATGRPAHHPATLLKIFVYGHLNRVQLSRRATPCTVRRRHRTLQNFKSPLKGKEKVGLASVLQFPAYKKGMGPTLYEPGDF
jgi:hypothetical protein